MGELGAEVEHIKGEKQVKYPGLLERFSAHLTFLSFFVCLLVYVCMCHEALAVREDLKFFPSTMLVLRIQVMPVGSLAGALIC